MSLIHNLKAETENTFSLRYFYSLLAVSIVVGLVTGFLISTLGTGKESITPAKTEGKTVGIADKKTFRDKAEGVLKEGGIDGEGNFHLQRPGGEPQNVYLTSTAVDLSQYLGKKIRVWGETFKGEKAGWLMDVGLVEVLQ